jgi:class 3 adenylate cyclase
MPARSGPTCSQCRQENPAGARFCVGCGARLASACAGCGADLPDGARFCPACGRAVDPAPASAAPAARPEPESYTPRHLAEKILTSRSAMQGERKPVTVLFCDLVSSTALAERLGADGMHGLLSRFFELALAEVHRYEGTVNQFLGDGFMALFGAPIAHEDHARRAVLAALDIRRAVGERPLTLPSGDEVQLTLRMGLHTGVVVVGAIGDNLRMDYTAVGDTSHLAARLQQAAEPGGILLSDATARLVEGYALLEARGPMAIRGRSEPLVVHALTGRGTRRSALDPGAGRVLSPSWDASASWPRWATRWPRWRPATARRWAWWASRARASRVWRSSCAARSPTAASPCSRDAASPMAAPFPMCPCSTSCGRPVPSAIRTRPSR